MLDILPEAMDTMMRDAIQAFPDECCGFLFGKENGNDRIISSAMVVNNSREGDKRRKFEIAPRDYLQAERFADLNQLALLGVYHSHPGSPAIPSEHDRVAAQPWFSYIILSVYNKEIDHLRSWRLNDFFQFEEEHTKHFYSPENLKNGNNYYSDSTEEVH